MAVPALAIDSAHGSAAMRIEFAGRDNGDQIWRIVLTAPGMSVDHWFRSFEGTGLTRYFDDLSQAWKGWDGTKTWSSLEGEMSMGATHDGKGHIELRVTLYGDPHRADWSCSATVLVEPGMLTGIRRQVRDFPSPVWIGYRTTSDRANRWCIGAVPGEKREVPETGPLP